MIKNRLKVLLAERDMNLSQLAELANIHYTTLRRLRQPGDIFVYRPSEREEGRSDE